MEYRLSRHAGTCEMVIGCVMILFFTYCLMSSWGSIKKDGATVGALVAWALVTSLFVLVFYNGLSKLLDNDVKLTITRREVKDHRTGEVVTWEDFRGIRLWVVNDGASATMYLRAARPTGEKEIAFEIAHLDQPYRAIAEDVHRLALDWAETQGTSQEREKTFDALWNLVEVAREAGRKLERAKINAEQAGQS